MRGIKLPTFLPKSGNRNSSAKTSMNCILLVFRFTAHLKALTTP